MSSTTYGTAWPAPDHWAEVVSRARTIAKSGKMPEGDCLFSSTGGSARRSLLGYGCARRRYDPPMAPILLDVLAEDLPRHEVTDVVVERMAVVGQLTGAVCSTSDGNERVVCSTARTVLVRHDVRGPRLRAGSGAAACAGGVVGKQVQRAP